MKILRQQWARRIFSLFTGLMFLNMSFLLSGISLLYPDDRQMIENVGKLVLNEEEKDAHGSETGAHEKTFACFQEDLHMRASSLFLIAEKLHHPAEDLALRDGHSENFSPPPEFHGCIASVVK